MNSKSCLAGFAILFVTASGQPLQRESDPNAMIAFYGGSGSQLLQRCEAALKIGAGNKVLKATDMQDAVDGSYCRGYVLGVVDGLVNAKELLRKADETGTLYCIPNNADSNQFVRVVNKYLNDNPATLNNLAGVLVLKSVVDAFPCK